MNTPTLAVLSLACLSATLLNASEPEGAKPFTQTLSLLGITFDVRSAVVEGRQELIVKTTGLKLAQEAIKEPFDGTITGAEVGDLNVDRSPELYVYVRLPGKEARARLMAWSANRKKSLSDIHLPELAAGDAKLKGYRGHDEYAVVESTLVRRFPIYKDGDSDDKPTGGTRQFQYKLKAGEAGWLLRLDKTLEY